VFKKKNKKAQITCRLYFLKLNKMSARSWERYKMYYNQILINNTISGYTAYKFTFVTQYIFSYYLMGERSIYIS
jgi:hypothetical protein